MLRVYHSNRLDVLEALMEFIVERERLDDPFEPEMILVQSTGMAQWLQMTLSQSLVLRQILIFRCQRALYGICSSGCYRRSPKRVPLTNRA